MTAVLFETDRLVLRRFEPSDAELLFELDSDPEVRRYVHAGPPDLGRIQTEILPRMTAYYERFSDLGYWAAELKPGREFAGWFHLRPEGGLSGQGEAELGYRLGQPFWGRGLATEGSRALVARGFDQLELPRIVAITLVGNSASQRVLEKVGFQRVEELIYQPPGHAQVPSEEEGLRAYRFVLERPS